MNAYPETQEVLDTPGVIETGVVVAAVTTLALAATAESLADPDEMVRAQSPEPKIEQVELGPPPIGPRKLGLNENASIAVASVNYKKKKEYVPRVPKILKQIGGCESGVTPAPTDKIRYYVQNPKSTASGGYQFLDTTWNNYKGYKRAKYAPKRVQDRRAVIEYKRNGTNPWLASKHCWG